jgi:phosphoribosylformylglycinamidine synthase
VDLALAPRVFRKLHEAVRRGLLRACHDLSEGGLAVAIAEMAFAGGVGADLVPDRSGVEDLLLLFSESATRFVVEVKPGDVQPFRGCIGDDVPLLQLGQTVQEPRLRIAGQDGTWLVDAELDRLRDAWRKPLAW